jgi:hypothetical protein
MLFRDSMPTFRASAPPSPNETPRPHSGRNIAIGLMATVAIIIIFVSGAFISSSANSSNSNRENNNPDYVPTPHTVNVISGSIVVNANGCYFVGFCVPEGALNPVLQGNFTSVGNGTNNNVILTVRSQTDFANWLDGRQCSAEYNKDLMPMVAGNINVALPSGIHYIFIDSAAYMQAQTVSAQIDLTYSK